MSRYIATSAHRGAQAIVAEADLMLQKALAKKGPETPVAFPNTFYALPVIYSFTGRRVEKLGELVETMNQAKALLHPVPAQRRWTPYLGETLDAGAATLLAEEIIEGVRFVYGQEPQRMPGRHAAGSPSFPSSAISQ